MPDNFVNHPADPRVRADPDHLWLDPDRSIGVAELAAVLDWHRQHTGGGTAGSGSARGDGPRRAAGRGTGATLFGEVD